MSGAKIEHGKDPWAHRRGEPRVFALLWMVFLMLAVGGSIVFVVQTAEMTRSAYAPAARIMLIVVAAGIVAVWPLVRLSQETPQEPVARFVAVDLLIVGLSTQSVVWPTSLLVDWPLDVTLGIAALLAVWTLLIGGLLALGLGGRPVERFGGDRGARSLWMAACLVVSLAAPATSFVMTAGNGGVPDWVEASSPFTGVFSIAGRGLSGATSPVSGEQWTTLGVTGVVGIVVWIAAAARAKLSGRRFVA